MRDFYIEHFGAACGDRYENPRKSFTSYFIEFESGARLELMHSAVEVAEGRDRSPIAFGYAHIAVSVGSEERVEQLTCNLDAAGCQIVGAPRRTGDGYYESVVLDPEGNTIEITV